MSSLIEAARRSVSRLRVASLFVVAGAAPAFAQVLEDEFHSSGRGCGYPGLTYDMQRVLDAVAQYPNGQLLILTPAEKRAVMRELEAWNESGGRPLRHMAPCFNCSHEFEACIVYERLTDEFYSQGGPGSEPPGNGDGSPPPGNGGDSPPPGNGNGPPPGDGGSSPPGPPPQRPTDDGEPRPRRPDGPTTTASCRDQVEVLAFTAVTSPSFGSRPERLRAPDGATVAGMSLFAGTPRDQAIRFTAEALVLEGPIPAGQITIRLIQNTTGYRGTLFNDIEPHDTLRFFDPACRLPLLDLFRNDTLPSPYYRLTERTRNGNRLRIAAHDSPSLRDMAVLHPDGARLARVSVTFAYSTHLGCTVRDDPATFESLERIDWDVLFLGDVIHAPPWPVDPPQRHLLSANWGAFPYRFDLWEDAAGIWADRRIRTEWSPRMDGPTFNHCIQPSRQIGP